MFASFRLFLLSAGGAALLGLSSCGDGPPPAASAGSEAAAKPAAAPVTAARYECPMGCASSQSAKPGKCPVCKMALVKKS
jgi:Heavy metal binding domain